MGRVCYWYYGAAYRWKAEPMVVGRGGKSTMMNTMMELEFHYDYDYVRVCLRVHLRLLRLSTVAVVRSFLWWKMMNDSDSDDHH